MKKLFFLAIAIATLGASCSSSTDGGVFRSLDGGETWEQKVFVSQTSRRAITIANENIYNMSFDPNNPSQIYAGTEEKGAFVTFNSGDQWFPLKGVTTGFVRGITVDPINPNNIYIARNTHILRTQDGGTTWEIVYTDTKANYINKVVVDPFNQNILYAITNSGAVVKSYDGGATWDLKFQTDAGLQEILINPRDSNIIFIKAVGGQFYRTTTAGEPLETEAFAQNSGWKAMANEDFQSKYGLERIYDITMDLSNPSTLYIVTTRGIMKSTDNGDNWSDITTLIAFNDPQNTLINNVTILPSNPNVIMFNVGRAIHKSIDGGLTWKTINTFPTGRVIATIAADPLSEDIIYIGTIQIEQEGGLLKL